jgi:hypothetical protein
MAAFRPAFWSAIVAAKSAAEFAAKCSTVAAAEHAANRSTEL